MIRLTTLSEARVLVIGAGDLVNEILRNLVSYGVQNLTVMDASTAADEKICQFIKRDPEAFITQDKDYFQSFHIVLAANQPRSFELALSDARWPKNGGGGGNPDLPMIIMRNASNTCKMRCQYHELLVNGGASSKFVSLSMDLLPWTDEKRALIASTIRNELKPEQSPTLQAYFTASLAVVEFQQSKGIWPGTQDKEQVQTIAQHLGSDSHPKVQEFIDIFCEGGLGASEETTAILSRLVVLDAIKLLTGSGQPINNTNMEEVIRIVGQGLSQNLKK